MSSQNNFDQIIKEASQLTGTTWSALVEREAGKWRLIADHHLAKKSQPPLMKFLNRAEVDSWLCGAVSGGQSRSVSLPESSKIEAGRLFAFPLKGVSRVVLAGADQMTNDAQRIWRLAVNGIHSEEIPSDNAAAASVAASLLVPDLDSENPFDMPRALDRALNLFYPPRPRTGRLARHSARGLSRGARAMERAVLFEPGPAH